MKQLTNFLILIFLLFTLRLNAQFSNTIYVADQEQLKQALTAATIYPINTIYCTNEFNLTELIILPGNLKTKTKTLEITKGAFTCLDTSGCFKRIPATQAEAETWMQNNIRFTDCGFYGKGTGTAAFIGAQYCGGFTNCYFYNFDKAIEQRFNLDAFNAWNRYTNCNQSSYQGPGNWPGSNLTKSCNGYLNLQNRAFSKLNGYAAFVSEENSSSLDLLNICEGEATQYDFVYIVNGNHAKNNNNYFSYIEKPTTKANFKITNTDGNFILENVWTQVNATLIDAAGSGGNSQIFLNNICYLPGQTKFKANGNNTTFNFNNVRFNWSNPAAWINRTLPRYYYGENSGTLHNLIYPGQSLRYNNLTIDSLISSFGYIKK